MANLSLRTFFVFLLASVAFGGSNYTLLTPTEIDISQSESSFGNGARHAFIDGVWVAVWESTHALSSEGEYGDVFFSRSTDHGFTWSTPQPLAPWADAGAADGVQEQDTTIAAASDGVNSVFVVAWNYYYFNSTTNVKRSILYSSRSTDLGLTWSTPITVQSFYNENFNNFDPRIATDGVSTFVLTYVSRSTPDFDGDIHYARSMNQGETWSRIGFVNEFHSSDVDLHDLNQQVAFTQSNVIVVWQSHYNPSLSVTEWDIYVRVTTDLTESWQPQQVIGGGGTDTLNDYVPRIAADRNSNRAMIAWYKELGDLEFVTSSDGGVTWSTARSPYAQTGSYSHGVAALGVTHNHWFMAYSTTNPVGGSGDDNDVVLQYSTDFGATWSTQELVNHVSGTMDNATNGVADIHCQDGNEEMGSTCLIVYTSRTTLEDRRVLGAVIGETSCFSSGNSMDTCMPPPPPPMPPPTTPIYPSPSPPPPTPSPSSCGVVPSGTGWTCIGGVWTASDLVFDTDVAFITGNISISSLEVSGGSLISFKETSFSVVRNFTLGSSSRFLLEDGAVVLIKGNLVLGENALVETTGSSPLRIDGCAKIDGAKLQVQANSSTCPQEEFASVQVDFPLGSCEYASNARTEYRNSRMLAIFKVGDSCAAGEANAAERLVAGLAVLLASVLAAYY